MPGVSFQIGMMACPGALAARRGRLLARRTLACPQDAAGLPGGLIPDWKCWLRPRGAEEGGALACCRVNGYLLPSGSRAGRARRAALRLAL